MLAHAGRAASLRQVAGRFSPAWIYAPRVVVVFPAPWPRVLPVKVRWLAGPRRRGVGSAAPGCGFAHPGPRWLHPRRFFFGEVWKRRSRQGVFSFAPLFPRTLKSRTPLFSNRDFDLGIFCVEPLEDFHMRLEALETDRESLR